jgi:hypothetical protein
LWTGRLVIATAGICGSALGLALGLVLGLALGLAAGAMVGLLAGVDPGGEVVVLVAVGGVQATARRTRPPNVATARHPLLICGCAKCMAARSESAPLTVYLMLIDSREVWK